MCDSNNSVSIFYKSNANNFSKTRVFPWPGTRKFLDSVSSNSKILDIGCGNGRNMFYRDDLDIHGLELSDELCKIVSSKGGKVTNGNMTSLPFPDNSFDHLICVAVYHHLNNNADRKNALNEMYRVLKPGGKVFIQVWAMEQLLPKPGGNATNIYLPLPTHLYIYIYIYTERDIDIDVDI